MGGRQLHSSLAVVLWALGSACSTDFDEPRERDAGNAPDAGRPAAPEGGGPAGNTAGDAARGITAGLGEGWSAERGSIEATNRVAGLLAFDRQADARPGEDVVLTLGVIGEGDEDDVVGTLIRFDGDDTVYESSTEVGMAEVDAAGTPLDAVDQPVPIDDDACAELCKGQYPITVEVAVRFSDGSVSEPTEITVTLDCREDGVDCEVAPDVGAPPVDESGGDDDSVQALASAVRPFYDAACGCDPDSPECAMAVDEDCALEVLYSYREQLGSRYTDCAAALETATGCLAGCPGGCTSAAELLPCAFYLVEPLASELDACLLAP